MADKHPLIDVLDSMTTKIEHLRRLDEEIMTKTALEDLEEKIIEGDDCIEKFMDQVRIYQLVVSNNVSNDQPLMDPLGLNLNIIHVKSTYPSVNYLHLMEIF